MAARKLDRPTPASLRPFLAMTHSMRNDGERGGPRHLCDRCSYEERVDSAWTGASVAQDFRGYGQAGIVPAYVREEEGCARD